MIVSRMLLGAGLCVFVYLLGIANGWIIGHGRGVKQTTKALYQSRFDEGVTYATGKCANAQMESVNEALILYEDSLKEQTEAAQETAEAFRRSQRQQESYIDALNSIPIINPDVVCTDAERVQLEIDNATSGSSTGQAATDTLPP